MVPGNTSEVLTSDSQASVGNPETEDPSRKGSLPEWLSITAASLRATQWLKDILSPRVGSKVLAPKESGSPATVGSSVLLETVVDPAAASRQYPPDTNRALPIRALPMWTLPLRILNRLRNDHPTRKLSQRSPTPRQIPTNIGKWMSHFPPFSKPFEPT